MNPLVEIAPGMAMIMITFLIVGGLLWLREIMGRRETVRIVRQIGLTDAIHGELGAAAAPEVRRGWLGGWTVSVAVPLAEAGTVSAVVRIAHDFFERLDEMDAQRFRIVLTPTKERRHVRPARPPANLPRAA